MIGRTHGEDRAGSAAFREFTDELISSGFGFRFQARGRSMLPTIHDRDVLQIEKTDTTRLKIGDIVLFRDRTGLKAHRIVRKQGQFLITRGDAGMENDRKVRAEQIVGKVIAKECSETGQLVALEGSVPRLRYFAMQARRAFSRRVGNWALSAAPVLFGLALLTLLVPVTASAQGVALDNANSAAFTVVGTAATNCTDQGSGIFLCSFSHTTNSVTGSTGLLLVGVSLNIKNNTSPTDSDVTAMTYAGFSMTRAVNVFNSTSGFRAEIWYLKSPPTGTNTVAVTVHKTGGNGNPIGAVMGAITVYNVNLGFTSLNSAGNNGSGGASATPSVTVSNVGSNDGVIDTLSVAGTSTVTAGAGEIQQWNNTSGTSGQDIRGSGSSKGQAGASGSSVTMSENLTSGAAAYVIAAVDVPALISTAVKTESFLATQTRGGALLSWNTSAEAHNLGFNLYREVGGQKVRLNPSLISGSALLMRDAMQLHGAKTYGWVDRNAVGSGLYWLEDVDLNGTRTMHGPISVQNNGNMPPATKPAITMDDVARLTSTAVHRQGSGLAHLREAVAKPKVSSAMRSTGFQLAAMPAVKIFVDHEGWYRVTQPQLVSAGLNPNSDADSLHLYAEGVEQPIRATPEHGRFGPQSAIEFYGTAIDTPYSGQRVYWLSTGKDPGLRITKVAAGSAGPQAQTFTQTLELKPRTTYFAALLRENTDNFFGPLISPTPETESLSISNLADGEGKFEISLQGVTEGQQHDVTVTLNGATLGDVTFNDQQEGHAAFPLPAGVLVNGINTIGLAAQGGSSDLSLVDTVDISFPHTFTAESDFLKFSADAGESVTVSGFVRPPTRVIDVTNPRQPFELGHTITAHNGTYSLQTNVPWTTSGQHTLLALSDAQLGSPASLSFHSPTNLHAAQPGAEYVVLTAPQLATQFEPLVSLHRSQGQSVALLTVDALYDEFNFGERTPYAIRDFLKTATAAWTNKPHYLVLGGDASVDPRNYLGFGFFDFVPTKILPTAELKTASDDWFSDFENTGLAKIATGRLPARTEADAHLMVGKIVNYAKTAFSGWTNQALFAADRDDPTLSFTQASQAVQNQLPSGIGTTDVFATTLGIPTAKQNLLAGLNAGQLFVNYNGHGSVEVWSGSDLFDDTAASSLTNGDRLPFFAIMNCLNGFFQDVYTQSLAESLMLAPNGGAVAVWASSGLTQPDPQFAMNQKLVQALFSQPMPTIGDAVLAAKSGITDQDVRKTFILFGDPGMRLQVSKQ